MLFHGCTPPKSKYFGFRSYLGMRHSRSGIDQVLFASEGATLNHLVLKTGQPSPFDTVASVVTTGDARTWEDIGAAFGKCNMSETLNLDSIPQKYGAFSQLNGSYVDCCD